MSSSYNIEPPPTAKVLLTTTTGDLLIELFAKQTPLASRSFLQHCLDGYYNDTIFHRLVPGFIVQGGDPTGTGEGGESTYETGTFEDEFHSRLKWNRRGLLGMANEGRKGTNGSQFFFSLGDCKSLEGKNTMFGRVVGDTIYNLLKIGEAELDDGDKPLYPTKITGAEILVNPYDDMVKKEVKRTETPRQEKKPIKKAKKKGGKALLSFGVDEDGDNAVPVVKKDKSNPALVDMKPEPRTIQEATLPDRKANAPPKTTQRSKRRRSSHLSVSPQPSKERASVTQLPLPDDEQPSRSASTSPEPVQKMSSLLDKTNAQIADIKASMKRTVRSAPIEDQKPKSALEAMMPSNAVRGKKRKNGERQTLDLLQAFKTKLGDAPVSSGDQDSLAMNGSADNVGGEQKPEAKNETGEEAELCDLHFIANCQSCRSWDETDNVDAADENDKSWMAHRFTFEADKLGKDLSWKKKNEDDLVVIDPREKSKDIKDAVKAKKMARTGGDKVWKQDRNRQKV